jgi:hypothetical protein
MRAKVNKGRILADLNILNSAVVTEKISGFAFPSLV